MANALVTSAWKARIPATAKLVLVYVCDKADEGGECFRLVKTVCDDTGLKERAVRRTLGELETAGFIVRDLRAGRSSIFRVVEPSEWGQWPEPKEDAAGALETPALSAPLHVVHPCTECTPAPDAPTPARGAPTPALSAPISSFLTTTYPSETYTGECASESVQLADLPLASPVIAKHVLAAQALIAGGIPAFRMDLQNLDLHELAATHPVEDFAKAAKVAVGMRKPHLAYALTIVRNGVNSEPRGSPGGRNPDIPPINASFEDQTYVGTPIEHLPPELREAVAGLG